MATLPFRIVGTRPGTLFLGGTETLKAVIVEARTVPHNIYFEAPVAAKGFTAVLARAAAQGWAQVLEGIASQDYVQDVVWGETDNLEGSLEVAIDVTVQSSSGNSAASFHELWRNIGPHLLAPVIAALHTQLDELEAT